MSLDSTGRTATPQEDAPPGERLGLVGWLRGLGFQGSGRNAPPRRWDRQNVCVVSDESDLVSANYGPRGISGGNVAAVVAEFSCFEITAGPSGVRVWAAHPSSQIARFGYRGAATTLTGGGTLVPVQSTDPAQVAQTRVLAGTAPADPALPGDAPDQIGAWAPTFIWVAPGRRLLVYRTTANVLLDLALILEEPGSAPR